MAVCRTLYAAAAAWAFASILGAQALIKDLAPGTLTGLSSIKTSWRGRVYFEGTDGSSGIELYKSDGSNSGTVLVKDIHPGSGSGLAGSKFAATDHFLYFVADDSVHGQELWRTEGTLAGTVLVADLRAGSGGSMTGYSASLTPIGRGNRALFVADDGVAGSELWLTNGDPTVAPRRFDMYPGTGGSSITGFARLGTDMLFGAKDDTSGHELWKLPFVTAEAPFVENLGVGCPGTGGLIPEMWTPNYYPTDFSFPAVGETFYLAVRNARPSSGVVAAIGSGQGSFPLGGGCLLYVDPILIFLFAGTTSAGVCQLPITLEDAPAYLGAEIWAQFAIVDPAGGMLGGLGTLSDAQYFLIGLR